MTKTLRVGIAPPSYVRERMIKIASGEKPSPNEPKVWVSSLDALFKVLTEKNMLLLEIIRRARPVSLKELAELSGRHVSNLSRTLRTMEGYGLVHLERGERGRITPRVMHDRVELDLPLTVSRKAS